MFDIYNDELFKINNCRFVEKIDKVWYSVKVKLEEDMELVKPFVKWAGGKGSLIPQLKNFYPFELENETINKYVEPFVGGGAVLINILQK